MFQPTGPKAAPAQEQAALASATNLHPGAPGLEPNDSTQGQAATPQNPKVGPSIHLSWKASTRMMPVMYTVQLYTQSLPQQQASKSQGSFNDQIGMVLNKHCLDQIGPLARLFGVQLCPSISARPDAIFAGLCIMPGWNAECCFQRGPSPA